MHSVLHDIPVLGVFRSLYNRLDSQVWVTPTGREEHAVTCGTASLATGSTHRGVALSLSPGAPPHRHHSPTPGEDSLPLQGSERLHPHSSPLPCLLFRPRSVYFQDLLLRTRVTIRGPQGATQFKPTAQTSHSLPESQAPHGPGAGGRERGGTQGSCSFWSLIS